MSFTRKFKGGYLNSVDRERLQRALKGRSPLKSKSKSKSKTPGLEFYTPESPPPSPSSLRIMGLEERFDSDGIARYYRISDGKEVPRSVFPSKPMQHYGPKALKKLQQSIRDRDLFFVSRSPGGKEIVVPEILLRSHIKGLVDRKEHTPRKFRHSTLTTKLGTPTKTKSKKDRGKSSATYAISQISSTRSNKKPKRRIKHTGQGVKGRRRSRRKHKSK